MHYLDTSALVAYYIPEAKSAKVDKLLSSLETAAVSSLTEVEFNSAVSRRVRMKEIGREDGHRVVSQFSLHLKERRFRIYPVMQREYDLARDWLGNFESALRTLDALHLAVVFSNQLELVTADVSFGKTARAYGVRVKTIS
jgi:predicted nucleic acid-binding protein